jgi:hypothetical protein
MAVRILFLHSLIVRDSSNIESCHILIPCLTVSSTSSLYSPMAPTKKPRLEGRGVSVLCSHPGLAPATLKRWGHGNDQGACTAFCRREAADC